MERVLHQSWQWVRAWVPPGLAAIALVATMIGLWLVMMDPDRSLFASERASSAPAKAERTASAPGYRQAASDTENSTTSAASAAALARATPGSECEAIQKEIDSATVRVRAAGKSRQSVRFRTRLRELKELYGEQCKSGAGPAT
jgi:hypothetical protein